MFAGTPVLLFGEALGDRIELTWHGGKLGLDVPSSDAGAATAMLATQASEDDMPAFCRAGVAPLHARARFSLFGMAGGTPPRAGSAIPSGNGLVDLAGMLEPDGGMPGDTAEGRIARTIAAVYAFAADGHTLTAGTFRLHVARLVGFLTSVASRSGLIEATLEVASRGCPPKGKWLGLAVSRRTSMKEIDAALK